MSGEYNNKHNTNTRDNVDPSSELGHTQSHSHTTRKTKKKKVKKKLRKSGRHAALETIEVKYDPTAEDPIISSTKSFLDRFAVVIPYVFLAFTIILVCLYIMGFIPYKPIPLREYAIYGIIGSILLTGPFGAWCVFKYGIIQDQIDRLREENAKFEHNIGELAETRVNLHGNVCELNDTVDDLKEDATEMDSQTSRFAELIGELKQIAENEEQILEVLDDTNKIFSDMRDIILENERTHLIACFYECAFRDQDNRMDSDEYSRFLGRLSKEQRQQFRNLGAFEDVCGADGCIDFLEFQNMLERVLFHVDQVLAEEFANQM